jgi:succinoglycan biosynthesis protein ExoA
MTDADDVTAEAGDPVLIVVPCLNEEAHLPDVLAALLADPVAERALIVVADGGSTDSSRSIVEALAALHPQVRLLDNPKRLQSAGFNLAVVRHGAGRPWLIRIDAHAVYPLDYPSRLIATAVRTGADSVVVPMRSVGVGCFQRAAAVAQNSVLGAGGAAHRRLGWDGWVDHGHHALFRAEPFLAAGGYDENFSHNEDAELDVRLTARGAGIWLASDLAIGYYPRRTAAALFRQYVNHGAGRARTVMQHRSRLKLRQWAPIMIAPAVLATLAAHWFWPAALPAGLWASASLGYGVVLGLRTRDLCACAAGVPAMIAHFGWSTGFWRQRLSGVSAALPAAVGASPSQATKSR